MESINDYSDEGSLQQFLMNKEGQIQQNINNGNQLENQYLSEKESHINKLINDESFEKAFIETFLVKSMDIANDKENNPPLMKDIFEGCSLIKPLEDEKIVIKVEEKNEKNSKNKYFPFTKGVGLKQALEKVGLIINYSSKEINFRKYNNKTILINNKFKTTDYYIDEKGKKKERKEKKEI